MDSMTSDGSGQESLLYNRRIHGVLILALLVLSIFLFAETLKAFREYQFIGGAVPVSNTITVTGEGEMFAAPDAAEFSFSVSETATTVNAATDAVAKKISAAEAVLKDGGVAEADVRTVSYSLQPQYEWVTPQCVRYPCPGRTRVQQGFTVYETLHVKVRDIDAASKLIGEVSALEVQNVSNLTFTLSDEEAVRSEARALAIDDAQAKAEELAEELGVSTVRIVGFSEGWTAPMPYARLGIGGAEMALDTAEVSIPVGENEITSHVTITYEIR